MTSCTDSVSMVLAYGYQVPLRKPLRVGSHGVGDGGGTEMFISGRRKVFPFVVFGFYAIVDYSGNRAWLPNGVRLV